MSSQSSKMLHKNSSWKPQEVVIIKHISELINGSQRLGDFLEVTYTTGKRQDGIRMQACLIHTLYF